jgi:hypothetical protein
MSLFASPETFTKAHYEANRGVAPAPLCELVVHCLELVSQLSHAGVDYRFKGGNSQLILLEDPQRFSIDVDIVSTMDKAAMIAAVEAVSDACDRFSRCEVRQHKTKPWLPMVSFKLFFDSAYEDGDAFVMLDAVLEPAPYGGVVKPVRCGTLYASDQTVEVPTVSGLIADKLLCVGPSTLGIPLGKNKEAQRLKHVFDVATLSRHDHDLSVVRTAVAACMEQENRIQKSEWSLPEVVADTAKFCRAPLGHAEPPPVESLEAGTYLDEIVRGYAEFGSFLFKTEYTWDRFKADMGRVAEVIELVGG